MSPRWTILWKLKAIKPKKIYIYRKMIAIHFGLYEFCRVSSGRNLFVRLDDLFFLLLFKTQVWFRSMTRLIPLALRLNGNFSFILSRFFLSFIVTQKYTAESPESMLFATFVIIFIRAFFVWGLRFRLNRVSFTILIYLNRFYRSLSYFFSYAKLFKLSN